MSDERAGFACPTCGGNTRTTDSRGTTVGVRRRRQCLTPDCNIRFTTYEMVGRPDRKTVILTPEFVDAVLTATPAIITAIKEVIDNEE